MSRTSISNPDHLLIHEFLAGDGTPRPFATSPLARELGMRLLAADAGEGAITLGFEPGEQFLQGNGCVQGGIVAAMLDFALAFAVMTRLDLSHRHATASFSVNLLQPVWAGCYLAHGRIQRMGSRLAFAGASLAREGAGEEMAATAAGTMLLRPAGKGG